MTWEDIAFKFIEKLDPGHVAMAFTIVMMAGVIFYLIRMNATMVQTLPKIQHYLGKVAAFLTTRGE